MVYIPNFNTNAYDQVSGAFNNGYNRRTTIDDDRAVRRAGQYASQGDTKRASSELMQRGMLKEGYEVEEIGIGRDRDKNRASILGEFARSQMPQAPAPSPGTSASAQLHSGMPRTAPSYGNVVQSEALSEPAPTDSRPGAKDQLMKDFEAVFGSEIKTGMPASASAQMSAVAQGGGQNVVGTTGGSAGQQMAARTASTEPLTEQKMQEQTGGNVSSQMLYSMASRFADAGDVAMAEQYIQQAQLRQGVEEQLGKAEKQKAAQQVYRMYAEADPEDAKAFVDYVLNDPNMRSQIPTSIMDMLTDGDERNDGRAMRAWAESYGVNVDELATGEMRERDAADAKRILDEEADRDVDIYKREAEVDFENDKKLAEFEGGLEKGGPNALNIPRNSYGVETKGNLGKDGTLWAAGFSNDPAGVQGSIRKVHDRAMDEAEILANAETKKAATYMSYVQTLDNKNLWDRLGSATDDFVARQFTPTEFKDLNVFTERLVKAEREATRGIFTDADAAQARRLGANEEISGEMIRKLMDASITQAERANEKVDFYYEYTNLIAGIGSIDDAKFIWRQYEKENPLLRIVNGQIVDNDELENFSEWYYEYETELNNSNTDIRGALDQFGGFQDLTDMRDF